MASDNISIQQQLNKLISDRQVMLEATTQEMKNQTAIAVGLAKALGSVDIKDDVLKRIEDMKKGLEDAHQEAEEFGTGMEGSTHKVASGIVDANKGLKGFVNNIKEGIKQFQKKHAVASAMFDGLIKGFKFTGSLIQGIVSLTASLTKGIFSVGKSILAIPLKILGSLIDMATSMTPHPELAIAFENVRKEFGSFKESTSRDVIASAKSMRGELANTGLSVFRVFGMAHERLDFFRELAVGMGPVFGVLGVQIAKTAEFVGGFQKALGISHEEMKGFGEMAIRTGKPLTEIFRDTANYTLQLGDTFGISQKLIGKDISKMTNNVKYFGSVTIKQMAESSVYARKLGVDVQKLFGVFDAFDNFEDAAIGAAKLSQTFGANVDALKLMNAQDPATRVEMLRQAMRGAGKDAANMTRQELNLLASQSGLDAETAKMVFSLKNQGRSLQDIQKESSKAEKKHLSQEEAMSKLADSIERIVRVMDLQKGGFFAYFFRGFQQGIKGIMGMNFEMTSFNQIMMNIRQSLMVTYWAGVQVGQMFRKMFPGVEQAFKGLADMFSPARFKKLFHGSGGIIDVFKNFFQDIGGDMSPVNAVGKLFAGFKNAFTKFFFGEGAAGRVAGEGFLTFGKTIVKILTGLIPVVAQGAANLLTAITGFIKNPKSIGVSLNKSAAGKAIMDLVSPLWEALKAAKDIIGPPLKDFLLTIGGKLKEFAQSPLAKTMLKGVFGLLFGPAIIGAVLEGAVVGLGGILVEKLGGVFLSAGEATAVEVGPKMIGVLGRIFSELSPYALIAVASVGISNGMKKYGEEVEKALGPGSETEAKIGSATAGLIDTLTLGLLPKNFSEKIAITIGEMSKAILNKFSQWFGDPFTNSLKQMLGGTLDLLGALGDVIKAIFSGDTSKIADALANFGKMFLKHLYNQFEFVFVQLPKLIIPFILEFGFKLISKILEVLSKLFAKGEDFPVVGWIFSSLKWITQALGWVVEQFAWLFEQIADYFKVTTFKQMFFDISLVFQQAWDAIAATWSAIPAFFSGVWLKVKNHFFDTVQSIKDKFSEAKDYVVNIFGGIFVKMKEAWEKGKSILSGVLKQVVWFMIRPFIDAFDNELVRKLLPDAFGKTIDAIKKEFEIHSDSKVMMRIGKNITGGLMKGMGDMPEVMSSNARQALTDVSEMSSNIRDSIVKLNQEVSNGMNSINQRQIATIKPVMDQFRNGMGASGRYTIEHKTNPVQINFKVSMDAGTVENVLVDRPNSRIATTGNK